MAAKWWRGFGGKGADGVAASAAAVRREEMEALRKQASKFKEQVAKQRPDPAPEHLILPSTSRFCIPAGPRENGRALAVFSRAMCWRGRRQDVLGRLLSVLGGSRSSCRRISGLRGEFCGSWAVWICEPWG
uniref:Uncharacterized protein n=1 Tax=Arundo donax TaxID=35708 RepID=A0A0A9DN87_ARUDO